MAHQFPTLYVREGIQDLAIPYCPDVFDPEQQIPISDARQWIDQFFEANVHKAGTENHGEKTWVDFNPTHGLGILIIRRVLPQSRSFSGGWNNRHEIASYARVAGPDLHPLLRISEDKREGVFKVTAESGCRVAGRSSEQAARELVQGALRPILAELGYGTPDEFAEKAVPLDVYRSERGIEWPPRYEP